MELNRKTCLFIAMSLDGYIAKPDGDIRFLDQVEQEGEDYGYTTFIESVDTVVLGRKTYDKVLSMGAEMPYGDRQVFVLTRQPQPAKGQTTFYSGSLPELILSLKAQAGKNIFCDGGAETVLQFLRNDFFDELTVSIIPVLLGEGIRLFGGNFPEQKLQLIESKTFEKGLVQLHYVRI